MMMVQDLWKYLILVFSKHMGIVGICIYQHYAMDINSSLIYNVDDFVTLAMYFFLAYMYK